MKAIATEYRTSWYERLGKDHFARVAAESRDDDRVWAWWVGHRREHQELAAMGLTG